MTDRKRNKRFRQARTVALRSRTRIQRDTAREILALLATASERIRAILAGAPTDYQTWSLPQLQAAIAQATGEFSELAAGRLGSGAGTTWEAGIELIDEPLAAGGARISAILPLLDNRQLQAMRTFMTDRMKDVGLQLANKLNSELGLVVIGAQTPNEAIGKVATLTGSARSRAITIVRTEIGRVYSTAAHERQLQAAEVLPGLQKQWRRSGKIHSRMAHDAADGQIKPVTEPFNIGGVKLRYPRDPQAPAKETINCGCESLPHMAHWEVANPKRKPFTQEEILLDSNKYDLAQAFQ